MIGLLIGKSLRVLPPEVSLRVVVLTGWSFETVSLLSDVGVGVISTKSKVVVQLFLLEFTHICLYSFS